MGAMASVWACSRRVSSTAAMPPRRSWRRARLSSIRFMDVDSSKLDSLLDQVAILGQFADEGIDLAQPQRGLRAALQIAAHEAVLGHAQLQRRGAGLVAGRAAVLLGQREHAHDAAHSSLGLTMMDGIADSADAGSSLVSPRQQLMRM